ncbi:Venom allergen 3 [Zootermopsis nevadensis]|uniref:Venom allergen 3 n=1 Tax=Zootermopsis nevadensis TaxID=136037 RepID=A0A067R547_ZOONE|nr:Venom allergen 3 [Zootermopsis nevadensis]
MLGSVLLASLVVAVSSQSTCSYTSVCINHTMCLYPTTNYGASCVSPVYSGVTSATDKQTIVNAHNALRSNVANGLETRGTPGPQPAAQNMRTITWDDELATVAQRWANQCTFQHDTCRSVGRFYVGQNIYMSRTGGVTPNGQQDWNAAVQAWYNEVTLFSKNSINPFQFSSSTGHYSQVLWADTYKVGCGFTAYTYSSTYYGKLYVCNYGPGGNVVGGSSSMYKAGTACNQCSGTCDDGLCV